jgi:hypothetical protein
MCVVWNVKTHDLWEGNVTTMSEIKTENICSLGFQDIREGVTLRRSLWWRLECNQISFLFLGPQLINVANTMGNTITIHNSFVVFHGPTITWAWFSFNYGIPCLWGALRLCIVNFSMSNCKLLEYGNRNLFLWKRSSCSCLVMLWHYLTTKGPFAPLHYKVGCGRCSG